MADDDKEKIILRCDCHSKHARAIGDFDKSLEDNREDHGKMWNELRHTISTKIFLTFVTIVVISMGSLFSFLWTINSNLKDSMSKIQSELASISTKVDIYFYTDGKNHKERGK